jgi:hypothetical protein
MQVTAERQLLLTDTMSKLADCPLQPHSDINTLVAVALKAMA